MAQVTSGYARAGKSAAPVMGSPLAAATNIAAGDKSVKAVKVKASIKVKRAKRG